MTHRSTRNRRPQPAAAAPAPIDRGLHGGLTRPYELLPAQEVDRLIESACALLRDTGCVFEPGTEAIDLLRAAGCPVSGDGVVRFDPALVRDAIEGCAKSVRLWDRDAGKYLELDTTHTWFMPGMTCIKVYDLASGERRPSTAEDLAMITRVADALPNIDGVCVSCKDVPHSDIHGEINEFATLIHNTTKPLEYLCENAQSLAVAVEMAAAVRGSRRALEEKPYFLQIVTPLPLAYWRTHSEQIISGARAGIPISVGTIPIGGASTPITLAGSIVNSLATDFAAMVLGQLARRGSFVIGSSDVCFMEPATGGIGNFTHASLADIAMHQVRRRLGIPSLTGFAGQSSARRFNQDAVWEISASMMQAFFSRPATLDYLGSLDEGITFSMHALCLCDELAGMLRSMWQGIAVSAETMALDLAHEVGPRGNYLAQSHTVAHCRDQPWRARYFGPHMPLNMNLRPDRELLERVDEDLRGILASHRTAALPADASAAIAEIQDRFRAQYRG
ncbi:MAG TPA: trimethylamine methyltransferase family protein [Steroidobacteraceae bacterium]|nr:trimethylamine methyltransferase family protein [Steroidobacteraceae bacterium]